MYHVHPTDGETVDSILSRNLQITGDKISMVVESCGGLVVCGWNPPSQDLLLKHSICCPQGSFCVEEKVFFNIP